MPPTVSKIVETSLYVSDLERSASFYRKVFGLAVVGEQKGRHVFLKAGQSILLLFSEEGQKKEPVIDDGGRPVIFRLPVKQTGVTHFAFEIKMEDFPEWERILRENGIACSIKTWSADGHRSIYFDDPDGNGGELITRGYWPVED